MLRTLQAIVAAIQLCAPGVSDPDAVRFAKALREQAQVHDFDPFTAVAMIHSESRFNPLAISPDGEDYGLAQVRARHVGACKKDKNPRRNPSVACRAVKERLLEPEESIRVMAELITSHRKLCRKMAGNSNMVSWLASYQGRNNAKEDRWCTPGDGTHDVIRYRDRLVREVTKRAKEIEAADQAAAAQRRAQVADLGAEPAPVQAEPAAGG